MASSSTIEVSGEIAWGHGGETESIEAANGTATLAAAAHFERELNSFRRCLKSSRVSAKT